MSDQIFSSEMQARVTAGWPYLTMGDTVSLYSHSGGDGWLITSENISPSEIQVILPEEEYLNSLKDDEVGNQSSLYKELEKFLDELHFCPKEYVDNLFSHLEKDIELYIGRKTFYKLGISQIFKGNIHIDLNANVRINLIPIPNWIEQSFNRRMVYVNNPSRYKGRRISAKEKQYLFETREKSLSYLFNGFGHLRLPFPNVLHLELAVITSDNYVICLDKALHSDYAKVGRGRTASLERSFILKKHLVRIDDGYLLDFYKASIQGLEGELAISENEVQEILLYDVAIETPNLNTGIIGICKININEIEIRNRLKSKGSSPHKYGNPIHLYDIDQEFLNNQCTALNNTWHPASQMRIYYTRRLYVSSPKVFISCTNSNKEFAYKVSHDLRLRGIFTFDFYHDVENFTANHSNIAEFMRKKIEECFNDPYGKIIIFTNPEYKEKADKAYFSNNLDRGVSEEVIIMQDLMDRFKFPIENLIFVCTDDNASPREQLPAKYRKNFTYESSKLAYLDLLNKIFDRIKICK